MTGELRWLDAGTVGDLPPGTMLPITVGGTAVLLVHASGSLYAVAALCTHEEAELSDGELDGDTIVCPVHFSRFDLMTGEALDPPADEPLAVWSVRVDGDRIQVALAQG